MQVIRGGQDIEQGLAALASIDRRLAPVILQAGPVPLRLTAPGFPGLAQVIVGQVVSKASAAAIWRRMQATGVPVTAAGYLAAPPEMAAGFGLSRAKAETLARVAEVVVCGDLDLAAVATLEAEEAIALLTGIKGIGLWTAEVYLMFCGGHADIFPGGDVALRAAVGHALEIEPRPSAGQLRTISEGWAPWRSVAARLFWAYYAVRMRRDAVPLPENAPVAVPAA